MYENQPLDNYVIKFSLSFLYVKKYDDCLQKRVPDKDRYRFSNIIRTMTPSRSSGLRSLWKLRVKFCLVRDRVEEVFQGFIFIGNLFMSRFCCIKLKRFLIEKNFRNLRLRACSKWIT